MPARKKEGAKKQKKTIIVKRGMHLQPYDERKVYASAFFACRNAHMTEMQSEDIAEKVMKVVNGYVKGHTMLLSDMIYAVIAEELTKYSEDASFLYRTHRDISGENMAEEKNSKDQQSKEQQEQKEKKVKKSNNVCEFC